MTPLVCALPLFLSEKNGGFLLNKIRIEVGCTGLGEGLRVHHRKNWITY